jgi:hypothetical protein
MEKPKPSTALSPDSIEVSTSSSSSAVVPPTTIAAATAAPSSSLTGSALQALLGKKIKPLLPINLETKIDKNQTTEIKKKDSPASNTDLDEDTSDIKTPPMSPRSPIAPMPTILELKVPPIPSKPLSGNYLQTSIYQYHEIFIFRISIK